METLNFSKLLKDYHIIIPIIQRDYAQGRLNTETEIIRKRFIIDLLDHAIHDKLMILDFVYGSIEENATFLPLDGQQRLTTLFLLHWYAARVRNVYDIDKIDLTRFSYETHSAARQFCRKLAEFKPKLLEGKISEYIQQNVDWWIAKWKDDPTISGMLTMLDDIDKVFTSRERRDRIVSLSLDKIQFYLFDIHNDAQATSDDSENKIQSLKEIGLTEDIYIKMNSRGLSLTPFERLKGAIIGKDSRLAKKFDNEWTNMLWMMLPRTCVGRGQTLDNYFLNYIRYACDTFLLTHSERKSRILNDFGMIQKALKESTEDFRSEGFRSYLQERFDMWERYSRDGADAITKLFERWLCIGKGGKGRLNLTGIFSTTNLFLKCCEGYSDTKDTYETEVIFDNGQVVLLYACETYLLHTDSVSESDFRKRLRWVRNLIWNSELGGKLPELLKETESIILSGLTNKVEAFSSDQLKQEIYKAEWCNSNPDLATVLYDLEEHPLMRGDVSIIMEEEEPKGYFDTRGRINPKKCRRFCDLFQMEENDNDIKEYKLLTRALLSMGPIWVWWGTWGGGNELDHITIRNRNDFFAHRKHSRTKYALNKLLCKEGLESVKSIENYLINDFDLDKYHHLKDEYPYDKTALSADWNYYFAKYSSILDSSIYGNFVWRGDDILSVEKIKATKNNKFWDIFLLGIVEVLHKIDEEYKDKVECEGVSDPKAISEIKIEAPNGIYQMHRMVIPDSEGKESKAYFIVKKGQETVKKHIIEESQDCVQQGVKIVYELLGKTYIPPIL